MNTANPLQTAAPHARYWPIPSDEDAIAPLREAMTTAQRDRAQEVARALVSGTRARKDERPYLDAFLQEFGLSNPEGVALMCLAETLLRVPDSASVDALIAEKLAGADWGAHSGASDSLFVNASTWGLMLTGRLVNVPETARANVGGWFRDIGRRMGDPVVRTALRQAMKIIGSEFVVGDTIESALKRSQREPALALCSFDMLGEGARTEAQAKHYYEAYAQAITEIANANRGQRSGPADLHAQSTLSIKLSALEPRYSLLQRERVAARLVPRLVELLRLAARHDLAVTIDAEEADRLELSLDVIKAVAEDPQTREWPGLGFAVQAYGKRAPAVIDWASDLAVRLRRPLAVRLVKGAYWDSEIKRAQERGLDQYPVYTRKVSTDVSYLGCARRLLDAGPRIYPQFATHNAHTIAAILAMRTQQQPCEFQRLHGMGVLLYDEARRQMPDLPQVRVYAPVGPHAELLAYLVRRLLENGANTSFVNRFMDESVPVADVVRDPFAELAALGNVAHPGLPLPGGLLGPSRTNSRGVDLGLGAEVDRLQAVVAAPAKPVPVKTVTGARVTITSPADRRRIVGEIAFATEADVTAAMDRAHRAQRGWNATPADERAAVLDAAAQSLEAQQDRFLTLLVQEAGKTLPDAIAEVREAVDFCRYYASETRRLFGTPQLLPGPTGETNELSLEGRGVIACISPWNFPLAIFAGQVVAALAAGNSVVAKPAETTPMVALAFAELLYAAGLPRDVLSVLPMEGPPFGAAALTHPALAGVAFTGSTTTAQWLNRALAARDGAILPLIAETGGLNAMIVDSTALPEQAVDDIVASAFGSAGQRCSALRILCVQDEVADRLIELIRGAMDQLVIGDPVNLATDVGPVITERAAGQLQAHIAQMRSAGRVLHACSLDSRHEHGTFVAPHLIALDSVRDLTREHFGPILHVVRYGSEQLDELLTALRANGYGLTMGVHTRLESRWRQAFAGSVVGNTYVNRNIIGAVVGVQPFGGSGLSGTGPKAGGPHYLPRFAIERTLTVNTTATGGNTALLQLD